MSVHDRSVTFCLRRQVAQSQGSATMPEYDPFSGAGGTSPAPAQAPAPAPVVASDAPDWVRHRPRFFPQPPLLCCDLLCGFRSCLRTPACLDGDGVAE